MKDEVAATLYVMVLGLFFFQITTCGAVHELERKVHDLEVDQRDWERTSVDCERRIHALEWEQEKARRWPK